MQRTDDSHLWLRRALIAVMLITGILSCTWRRPDVPVNGWWASRGPVVPHDTFPADCTLCHKGGDWQTLREDFNYDHTRETGFVLEGAHAKAECLRCHNDRGPVAAFVSRGCSGCHEDVHQGMAGNECSTCHAQADWRPKPEIANHSRTRFPLVGAHAATACWRCHPGAQVARFDHADPECISCHASDFARASNPTNPNTPNHGTQGWISGCDRCHIPTSWGGAGFNHATFPLTGKHATTACAQCHLTGHYAGTPQDCYSCHVNDYNSAASPNHLGLGVSTRCQDCHSTSTWLGAHFNHVGITNGCVNCHQTDYNATTSPDHTAMGISTQCETCHNTNDWHGASFNHVGITNGCVTCHQSEYNATTNPNHTSANFPTSCEACHDTLDWTHGVFQHTFPINSGHHSHFQCVDCHTTPGNFLAFSCINCHEHSQSNTDGHHHNTPGYLWESQACLHCHPTGHSN